jgi:GT2 family glycosyltransferase
MDMKISFIIPNWNHKQLLKECVLSIINTAANITHEIIIIDNASTDGSRALIKDKFPDIILIENEVNLGYAKAVNQGVRIAKGEVLFLLNNDVMLSEGATGSLLSFLYETPSAGAVAPILYYPDGRFQLSCRRFPTVTALALEYFSIKKLGTLRKWKMDIEEHTIASVVPQPMAAALLIRRDCWNKVGYMDEGFPIFFNDVDWCYRLYKNTEYKIYIYPEAKAVHHEGASIKRLGFKKKAVFYKGLLRFYIKHPQAMMRGVL